MDGFWRVGADGRILDCNEAACAILGYSRSEMLSLLLHDIDVIEDETAAAEHMRLVIDRGHDRFETRHRRKDGSLVDVEVSAYHVSSAEGRFLFAFSRDVTARKAAQKALQASEARYRAVVDQQTELIARSRQDGTLTFVNEVACRMSGRSAAELVGCRWQSLIHPVDRQPLVHPDDLPMIAARLSELTPESPVAVIEIRFRAEDGGLAWFQFFNRGIFDDAGRLAEIQFVGRDITKRRQTEIALQNSEDITERMESKSALQELQFFNQAVLDAVSAQVAVLDRQGNIIKVNDSWNRFAMENASVFGHAPRNVDVGVNYLDICRQAAGSNAEGALNAAQGIKDVLDRRIRKYDQEYPCHSPDAQRWFLMTVTPLGQADGGVVISHHDISSSRRLAEELRQSEGRIRSILQTAPVGIGVLVDRAFVQVNEAFVSMTGHAAEDLIGRSARMLYPTDDDFDYVGREKYHQIRQEGIGRVEARFLTKDGRIIDVALSSAPVVPGDLSHGTIFAAQDITATKRAEQERLARNASQRDALVREVHHRIKNHLQGVLGLMHNTMVTHPELAGGMEFIVARVRAIAEVYGLQCSRADAQVRVCELTQTAVEGGATTMPVIFRRTSQDMEALLSPDEAVPIALVINELITNAVKHSAPPGVAQPIQANLQIAEGKVTITVANSPAFLPPGFDFAKGEGIGTGLELLKVLLPKTGSTLTYRQQGAAVVAELVLELPVVICRQTPTAIALVPGAASSTCH